MTYICDIPAVSASRHVMNVPAVLWDLIENWTHGNYGEDGKTGIGSYCRRPDGRSASKVEGLSGCVFTKIPSSTRFLQPGKGWLTCLTNRGLYLIRLAQELRYSLCGRNDRTVFL